MPESIFSKVASEVFKMLHVSTEWQRVNGYIADALKDSHVLYSKLVRLQGDFKGEELQELQKVSESVLSIGESLSHFSKAFYEGRAEMVESTVTYGKEGGAPIPVPQSEESGEIPVDPEVQEEAPEVKEGAEEPAEEEDTEEQK